MTIILSKIKTKRKGNANANEQFLTLYIHKEIKETNNNNKYHETTHGNVRTRRDTGTKSIPNL